MTQGIYEIVNLCDGKASTYIGSSVNIEQRWGQHRSNLRVGRHGNAHLQAAWNKYGEDAFVFSVLEEVSEDMLLVTEQEYLDDYFDRGHCYNIAITAGPGGPLPEEIRRKISKTLTGKKRKPFTEEHKRKLSKAAMGRRNSEEAKRKMSEAHRGKVLSEEHKYKLSEAGKGRIVTEETKRKISKANKGNQPWSKGKNLSEEHRRRISEALIGNQNGLGHKPSEETKCKISEALKQYWAKRRAAKEHGHA